MREQARQSLFQRAARMVAVVVLAVAGIAALPGRAAGQSPNLVVNGGFEAPAITGQSQELEPTDGPRLSPWVVGGRGVDLVRSFWQPAEGAQSINLNGDGPGSVAQTLSTQPGRYYKLRFRYSVFPSRYAQMRVQWGPGGSASYTELFTFPGKSTKSNMGWVAVERTVQATSSATLLSFTSVGGNDSYGNALDDVQVTATVADQATLTVTGPATVPYGTTAAYATAGGSGTGAVSFGAGASTGCTVSGSTLTVTNGSGSCALTATKAGDGNYYAATSVPFPVQLVPPPFATPILIRAVATGGTGAFLIGLVDGAPGLPIAVQVYAGVGCANGALVNGSPVGGAITLSTDGTGYFGTSVSGVPAGGFVAVQVTSPALTAVSACIASSGDNDTWPKALRIADASPTARDYIDAAGKSRWYKFDILPGQRIGVALSGLPADYDLAVFKDIGATFLGLVGLATTPDLTRLSAEYAPSAFSPSAFSPSAFSPSAFSSDNFAMAFSSAQTRSIIGVSATPGTGNEFVVVNTWNNVGSFYVRVTGRAGAFSTGGQFTLNVAKGETGCAGVTDTTLTPRPAAAAAGIVTVILTDSSRLVDGGALAARLAAFAARGEIGGVVVDVAGDARVGRLKAQAANNAACPFATNLVAEEIKGIVDAYRTNNPGLRYVVIAGGDGVIPFFRYPDQSLLGQESGYVPPVASSSASEASLRNDYLLSQDAYGSGTRVSLRSSSFPVPGLAVGRLVETSAEIAGMIDAYIATDGVVTPRSSLVTGYDFLADAADAVTAELRVGTAAPVDTLIAPNGVSPQDPSAWTAVDLAARLFGGRHDVVFLAGHFSANSALAADFTTSLITTDLAASTANFTNAIVFSAGCHSGYNLVDGDAISGVTLPLDWAQAFAQKKATLIAGTGYQYGDTDFIEYSERLYLNFTRQLRTGNGVVSVGEALARAKLGYLAATPDLRGIHEKALLEATLFGLPMLGVNMPGARLPVAGLGPVVNATAVGAQPARSLGLETADIRVAPSLTSRSLVLNYLQSTSQNPPATIAATWWEGPQGVVSNPAEPALPLAVVNVTPVDGRFVLRGVGFRGGAYADDTITPLTGAATDDLRGVHVPFVSPVFFPMRPWTVNYFGALAGNGATSLLVTPAQHRAADIALGTSTRRTYAGLDLRLYYSGNLDVAALSDAPSIVAVSAQPNGAGVVFSAQVVGDPAAAIHQVWVTTTSDGAGAWTSLDLAQCVAPLPAACGSVADSGRWVGALAGSPANLKYVVQAVNGYGLVTLDDNYGAYYSLGGANPAATAVALISPPTSATFGDSLAVTASLTSGGAGVAGRNVIVAIGGTARVGTTDAGGQVTVDVPVVSVPASYQVVASFGGDANYLSSAASAGPIVVAKAPTSISALAVATTGATATATLTASIGGKPQPLLQEAVTFTLSATPGSPVLKTVVVNTDYLGRAPLPSTGLPAGTYSLSASFAGNATYTHASAGQTLSIARQTLTFGGVSLPGTLAFDGAPVVFTVSSASGLPPVVTLSPDPSAACRLSFDGSAYTLTPSAPGICTLVASAGGTTTFTDVTVTQNVAIVKADQTVVVTAPVDGPFAYGDTPFIVGATGGASGNPVTFSTSSAACTTTAGPGSNVATVAILGVGACTIVADQAGNGNYNAAQATKAFSIVRKTASVSPAPAAKVYGSADPALTGTLSGFLPADGVTATYSRAPGEAVGSYPISATLSATAALANYDVAAGTAQFTITRASTSTTVATSRTPAATGSVVTFTATVSSSGATGSVQFLDGASSLGVQTVSGGQAALSTSALAVGSHAITAVYGGDANYGGSTSAGVTQTVDNPPVAAADAYGVLQGGTLAVGAPGVLGNDSDADAGQSVQALLLTGPAHGAIALNADGSFSYTPVPGFTGVDGFSYQATDGLIATDATVTITVLAPADATAAANDAYATVAGGSLTVTGPGVLGNDNGQALTALQVSAPAHAQSFSLNADGSFSYVPLAGFTGVDSFLYRAQDGANRQGNLAMATIAVQAAGAATVAVNDAYIADQGTPLDTVAAALAGVLANDAGATTAAMVSGPLFGTLALHGAGAFVYTPNAGFSGIDSFTYVAGSAAASGNLAMATILVRSATTITLGAPAATYPANGVVTVAVAATAGTPAGDVSLSVDGAAAVVAPLDAGGRATFALPGLNAGAHALRAGYAAQGSFGASSATGALSVNPGTATLALSGLTATYDGTPKAATATTSPPGLGVVSITYDASAAAPTNAGSYAVVASLANPNYTAANATGTLKIAPATAVTTLLPSLSSLTFGQMVTLKATVTAPPAGTPTGSVTFRDGTTTLGAAVALDGSGAASYLTNALAAGTHSLTAVYSGDANDAGSTSLPVSVTVAKVATTTTLASSRTAAAYGASVSLTATVAPAAATGTVLFRDGSNTLATAVLNAGSATFAANALAVGVHSLTASYGGDANDAASISAPVTVTIDAVFTPTGSMAQPRSDHSATLLNDGRVLVAGGFDAAGAATATSEVYCPASMVAPSPSLCQNGAGRFSTLGTLPSKSAGHTSTLLPNGKVLSAGGGNSSAELFDPATNSWTTVAGFSSVRSYHTATLLASRNLVLFTGGAGNSGSTLRTTVLYNLTTGSFTAGPAMTAARERHTATLLPNGKLLIAGGRASGGASSDDDDLNYTALGSAEIYDPATNSFTAAPPMKSPRESHAAVLLASGRVLVGGGGNGTGTAATADVYDPATNAWTATGPMRSAREGYPLTVLANGKVLAAGGRNPTGRLNSGELYDPALSTFQPVTSAMNAFRTNHTATLLADGSVLVVGGKGGATSGANVSVNTAELYGPSAGP